MYIIIGDNYIFDTDIWSDVTETWAEAASLTWVEFSGFEPNGKLLLNPAPTIHHAIEERSTAEFSIIDVLGEYHFDKGEEVQIFASEDGNLLFGGYVEESSEEIISSNNIIKHEISCSDYHYLSDKRIVAKAFTNTTIHAAVDWILDNVLAEEGISIGSIQTSDNLTQYVADYISATEAIDDLAEMAGYTWWISEDKKLYFVDRGTYAAAWDLEETSSYVITDALEKSVKVTNGNPEYRNKQYIKGAKATTDTQTEYKAGDGSTQSWALAYELSEEPEIWEKIGIADYVQKTVGIKGTESDHDYYWSTNDNTINQDFSASALTSSDKIKIIYKGLYPVVAVSANFGEIISRQAIEGDESSGIVEAVFSDSSLTSMDSAMERANALLDHYAEMGKKIEYQTTRSGLSAGVLQGIKITKHNIDDECLIGSIDIEADSLYDYYTVNAYTGPVDDDWTKIFLKLKKYQQSTENVNVGASNVVLVLQTFTKTWTSIESPNIWQPSTYVTLPGDSFFPCFDPDDRIKYIALYYGGHELYRMYRTSQTSTTSQIITTFIIPSQDANDTFDQVKLFGGSSASLTEESGLCVGTYSWSYTKNSLESLQKMFTDNKWS